jgi:molybdopterin synthase sulfurtransferase
MHASPPSRLARPQQLVAPAWLARQGMDARVIEVGCDSEAQYLAAHIPGASYLDTRELETPPLFNKVPDAALLAVLLRLGIRHATTVVLYGRNTLAAARAAHLMLYAGVTDVRLLDGGFARWCAEGHPVVAGPGAAPASASAFGAPFPGRSDFLIDMEQAKRLLARDDAVLASIRTWSEHTGATSGYSYIAARGDIPGARWGRAGREGDVNSMSDYQDAAGCMLPGAVVEAMWREQGIHAGLETAFYCGTGWRASLAFFYAWVLGWPRISVYDGGWYEWSSAAGRGKSAHRW